MKVFLINIGKYSYRGKSIRKNKTDYKIIIKKNLQIKAQ